MAAADDKLTTPKLGAAMLGEDFYGQRKHDNEIELVSVQSAKGGVGKTMLAFLLANHLCTRTAGARVVVLDLDFTGTTVADLFTKATSEEELHGIPVRLFRDANGGPTTLFRLFEQFLHGKDLSESFPAHSIRALWQKDKRRVFHVASGRTYSLGRNELFSNIPFDANHATWFVDYLFELFSHLERSMRDPENPSGPEKAQPAPHVGPLYVVLDNAPGQSEFIPALQERMLRWGRHRAKFIQVASLDEMDIRASLTVLSRLHDRFETIHATKESIGANLKGNLSYVVGWGDLLNRLDEGKIDREFLEQILADGEAAVKAVIDNGEQETRSPNYMALVINRVFETVDLRRVDSFILEQSGKLLPEKQKPTREFLTRLRRDAFPFDQALALFFQEQFLQKRMETDGVVSTTAASALSQSPPPAEPPTSAEVEWDVLATHDVDVYRALYGPTAMQDAGFLKRSLIRGVGVRDVSHLMRGFDVLGRLLDLCHRIVRECRPDVPFTEERGTTFRLEVMRALEDELRVIDGTSAGADLFNNLAKGSFINNCLGARRHVPGAPPIGTASLESFRQVAASVQLTDAQLISPVLQQMLDLCFTTYGVFVAFPYSLDIPSVGDAVVRGPSTERPAPETRWAILKKTHEEFFQSIYLTALTVAVAGRRQDTPPVLCALLEEQFNALARSEPANIHHFHLELADVAERVRFYAESLNHAANASLMLLRVLDELPQDNLAPTELTELYVHTVLTGLFHGLRSDTYRVHTEVLGLFHGQRSHRLTERAEQRLGWMLSHVFVGEPDRVRT